jgi:hypothetical protein
MDFYQALLAVRDVVCETARRIRRTHVQMVAEVHLAYVQLSAAVLLTMRSGAIVATEELADPFVT